MLVQTYDPRSAQVLGAAIVAGAGNALHPNRSAAARVVAVGGGWHLGTWREGLRGLAQRGLVGVVAVRSMPGERRLVDADWSWIMGRLAGRVGLAERPWAAVRTSPTTIALLTNSNEGPLRMDLIREYARVAAIRLRSPLASAAPSRPAGTSSLAGNMRAKAGAGTAHPYGLAQLSFAAPPDPAEESAPEATREPVSAAPGRQLVSQSGQDPVFLPGPRPSDRPHNR